MAERGKPSGEDAEFDWIYGGARPGSAPGSDPEPTRMLPQLPRPGQPAPPRPEPGRGPLPQPLRQPEPYGVPAGPGVARPRGGGSGGGSKWLRPRRWIKVVTALIAIWVAFLLVVPFLTWKSVDKVAFEPEGDRPADQPGTTYLLVGSDSRAGLSKAERRRLHTGNASSELTDTILLLHTGSGPTTLVSIPRDSPLDIPGFGVSKVNSAFAKGGTPKLTETLEQATGVRIDQYVEVGFGGLVGVVDAVGGIEICPKQRIVDRAAGLRVKKGCQEVDGATALAYARARKYSPISDLARVQQQREVISAVGKKVLSPWSVLNPVRYWKLNHAVPDFFRFGDTTGPIAAAKWALAMTGVKKSCTVPLARADATWDTDRAKQLFDKIANDETDKITKKVCTATGLPG